MSEHELAITALTQRTQIRRTELEADFTVAKAAAAREMADAKRRLAEAERNVDAVRDVLESIVRIEAQKEESTEKEEHVLLDLMTVHVFVSTIKEQVLTLQTRFNVFNTYKLVLVLLLLCVLI